MSYCKNIYLGLLPIFKSGCFLMLSFTSCLDIFNIKPQSVMLFTNIFSSSVGCLIVLFIVSFAVQKLLILIKTHLFIFPFISFALGDRLKKCYNLCQIELYISIVLKDIVSAIKFPLSLVLVVCRNFNDMYLFSFSSMYFSFPLRFILAHEY